MRKTLFIPKYQLYFPTEKELKAEIERDVLEIKISEENK